jgi:hypothetical protein
MGTSMAANAPHSLSELRANFRQPPPSARPWVYWFWLNGNVSRAGITADLESMQRVGIGGAILLDIVQDIPSGPVRFGSPEWRDLFRHAANEAARLGLQIVLHNAPGWTGSGGPWITPDLAMQKVIWAKTNVSGPARFHAPLPTFTANTNLVREIAVLAFPTLVSDGAPVPGFAPAITSSASDPGERTYLLFDNPGTLSLPVPTSRKSQYLQLEFAEPFTASILKLLSAQQKQSFSGALQVSDNGRSFRTVREFLDKNGGVALTLDQITARYFRLLFTRASPAITNLAFSELVLAPSYRIQWSQAKTGLGPLPSAYNPRSALPKVPAFDIVSTDRIINLCSNSDSAGFLTWDVPPGQWTILRLAHEPIGTLNHPAPPGGEGLECDKLSRQAIKAHFDAFLAQMATNVGLAAARAFTGAFVESWEVGFQNWTPRFREEFLERRGYDLLRFLPVYTGRFVGSPEQSERFLWDVRRTIADLVADNYAGHLAELSHEHGLNLTIEAYGNGPLDALQYASRADIPMSEFWNEAEDNARFHHSQTMAWAAHTSGKSVVAAEAFTAYPEAAKWQNHPFSLKPLADAAFCAGVNRLVIHRFAHQPWIDRWPGMTMGPWGIHYERTETWWEQSKPWHEYLARCQFLLRNGLPVADICYLSPEQPFFDPPPREQLEPPLSKGWDCDMVTPEIVLSRMTVKDGRLVLPDGMSYRLLMLPSSLLMTPRLLHKLKELVEAGATLAGPRPAKSPSLEDYPQCDMDLEITGRKLWGSCDGKSIQENKIGKGKIIWGKPLGQILREMSIEPDFQQVTSIAGYPLGWIHRRFESADCYFIANSNNQPIKAECRFRVSGRAPELWRPDTGEIERPAIWSEERGLTTLPLQLDAGGSTFVIFPKDSANLNHVVSLTRDGRSYSSGELAFGSDGTLELAVSTPGLYCLKASNGKILKSEVKSLPNPFVIPGPWEISFPSNSGAPDHVQLNNLVSWSQHPVAGVKYFSGTATYTKIFTLPAGFTSTMRKLYLDLGEVEVIAEVKLNGHELAILWKPPFEADITGIAQQGQNRLEIKITNLWPNRLIGDEHLPEDCEWRKDWTGPGLPLAKWPQWLLDKKPSPAGRLTFTTWKHWTKDSPLLVSGLLGPVTLRVVEQRTLGANN